MRMAKDRVANRQIRVSRADLKTISSQELELDTEINPRLPHLKQRKQTHFDSTDDRLELEYNQSLNATPQSVNRPAQVKL